MWSNINNRVMVENIWFEINQTFLLWLFNTKHWRSLFSITEDFPRIFKVTKNSFHGNIGEWEHIANFYSKRTIADILVKNWKEYEKAENWYYQRFTPRLEYFGVPLKSFTQQKFLLVATATSFAPDKNPETSSVDGNCGRTGANETFATIRNGAGTTSQDSTGGTFMLRCVATTTSNQFSQLYRGVFLFDTSSIGASSTISSATFKFYADSFFNTLNLSDAHASVSLVGSTPGSNTALVNGDFANIGTTRYASDYAYSSLTTGYNTMTLNATGISNIDSQGITKLATRFAVDLDGGTPNWVSGAVAGVNIQYADGGANSKPTLTVIYQGASVPCQNVLMIGI